MICFVASLLGSSYCHTISDVELCCYRSQESFGIKEQALIIPSQIFLKTSSMSMK